MPWVTRYITHVRPCFHLIFHQPGLDAVDRRCAEWRLSGSLELCTADAESELKRKRDAAEQPYDLLWLDVICRVSA